MRYYGRDSREITRDEWSRRFAREAEERRIEATYVPDEATFRDNDDDSGVWVSTVWIGIEGEVFETMVFDGVLDGKQWRADTEAQARLNHETAVAEVKATQ